MSGVFFFFLTKNLFGKDASGKELKPFFTFTHHEDGTFTLNYEFKDAGLQKSTLRPRPRNFDFDYLFIGAEVKIGVSDPVGTVTSKCSICKTSSNHYCIRPVGLCRNNCALSFYNLSLQL